MCENKTYILNEQKILFQRLHKIIPTRSVTVLNWSFWGVFVHNLLLYSTKANIQLWFIFLCQFLFSKLFPPLQVSTIVCKRYLGKSSAPFTIKKLREGLLLSSPFDFSSISRTDRQPPQGLCEYSRHAAKQNKSSPPPRSTVPQDTSKVTWPLHTFPFQRKKVHETP